MSALLMSFCCGCAALPLALVASNLRRYLPLGAPLSRNLPSVSVLIPARNEEANIRQAVESVLHCEGVVLEVLVWDDASTDATADVVRSLAVRDPRVRLFEGTPPPPGWAGKPWGCQQLSEQASGDILLFIDADVRLRGGDGLARLASAFLRNDLDLLSGVPWQRVETLAEVMVVPLIHFVLLGFLPMGRMRASKDPRFAAACGQFMAFRREAYRALGGHALARSSFHEGLALARAFRQAGRVTDVFDATDLAVCRMYSGLREVWRGFAKNAQEGIGSVRTILPFTVLLGLGQVVPFMVLLPGDPYLDVQTVRLAWLAWAMALLTRGILAFRFRQPWSGVALQPFAVGLLLLNQWYGSLRYHLGRPVGWKGRTLAVALFAAGTAHTALGAEGARCPDLLLEDQNGVQHEVRFPRNRPAYLLVATREGTEHIAGWVKPIANVFGERIEILGLAAVGGVPRPFRSLVRRAVRAGTQWTVLMDWEGESARQLLGRGAEIEVYLVEPEGRIRLQLQGAASSEGIAKVKQELERMLARRTGAASKLP